jgi:dihydroorotate dehydrogenase
MGHTEDRSGFVATVSKSTVPSEDEVQLKPTVLAAVLAMMVATRIGFDEGELARLLNQLLQRKGELA